MTGEQIHDLMQPFYFKLTVEGLEGDNEGAFETVSGLDIIIKTEKMQEGGENKFLHRLPGQTQGTNIVLTGGVIYGTGILSWITDSLQSLTFNTRKVLVTLLDEKGNSIASWSFHNAWPVSVKISGTKTAVHNNFIETLEFAYEHYERAEEK